MTSPSCSSELLYGRVGYLFACAFLNKHHQEIKISEAVTGPIVQAVLGAGRKGSLEYRSHLQAQGQQPTNLPPLLYEWHHKCVRGSY